MYETITTRTEALRVLHHIEEYIGYVIQPDCIFVPTKEEIIVDLNRLKEFVEDYCNAPSKEA